MVGLVKFCGRTHNRWICVGEFSGIRHNVTILDYLSMWRWTYWLSYCQRDYYPWIILVALLETCPEHHVLITRQSKKNRLMIKMMATVQYFIPFWFGVNLKEWLGFSFPNLHCRVYVFEYYCLGVLFSLFSSDFCISFS